MKNRDYKQFIDKFLQVKVLVVGDTMLDLYITGRVERISPEAPVPVVLEESRKYFLGGAGNVAANVASLGGKVTLVSAVGKDAEGKLLEDICRKQKITPHFIKEAGRPTTHKTRAISGHHQLLRIDREETKDLSKKTEKSLVKLIKNLDDHNIVIISDYAKGSLTEPVVNAVKYRFGSKKIIVNIKPPAKAPLYRGVYAVTLNAREARDLSSIDTLSDAGATRAAKYLSHYFRSGVVLTRGDRGMLVYDKKSRTGSKISSNALQVFDVTGAGDTVIATLAMMLGAKSSLPDAAYVSSVSAGVVVGVKGTAAIKISDLKFRLS